MSDTQDAAPLIQRDDDRDARDRSETRRLEEGTPGVFVWMLTLSAGISGLLFGCENSPQSLISPTTPLC